MRPHRRLPSAVLVAMAAAGAGGCRASTPTPTASPSSAATTVTTGASMSTNPAVAGEGLKLELRGLGPVRVGMTVDDAARALGRPLQPVTAPTDECTFYAPASGFDGLSFLVAGGTVARVDVTAGPTATAEGMAIGQSEAEAKRRYGVRLRESPHDFLLGGHYLTLVPADPADANFRLVAETDGTKVTSMRAGRLPEIGLTEGCA